MKHSEKFLRKRKALLMLPLLALPFITLAFWALGGRKGSAMNAVQQKPGMNISLPDAQLSGASMDKMSLYAQAAQDSQAKKNELKNDLFNAQDTTVKDTSHQKQLPGQPPAGDSSLKNSINPNEAKINAKLSQLERTISQPPQPVAPPANSIAITSATNPDMKAQVDRLQQMMQSMNQSGDQDPQMQQINGMLEKILDIEHPDRVKQQLKEQSEKNRGRVYPVTRPQDQGQADLFGTPTAYTSAFGSTGSREQQDGYGFYDIDEQSGQDAAMHQSIPAVVQSTQTVTSGSTIKLRITEDVFIDGVLIPKNNFIYGSCSVEGDRLKISLTGIRFGSSLFPVSLSVYDLDALEGICIPGAIGRDASKEGADRGIQSVELTTLDQSVGAQAADAGLEAAKGLFSKKVRLVRVTVKAGYPVLLMDQKAKQEDK